VLVQAILFLLALFVGFVLFGFSWVILFQRYYNFGFWVFKFFIQEFFVPIEPRVMIEFS
jgi:hypothetical protein